MNNNIKYLLLRSLIQSRAKEGTKSKHMLWSQSGSGGILQLLVRFLEKYNQAISSNDALDIA